MAASPSAVIPASGRRALRAAARSAEEARDPADREAAENDLARVLADLDEFTGPGPRDDDLTVLVLRIP